ncbi:unnamed protein product, partial [marine sediment metagenome]
GSREREDTRYILKTRKNARTLQETKQVLLDPACIKARRKR